EIEAKQGQFLSDLAAILINILIYGKEVEHRYINPWLELLMAEFGNSSIDLRRLASTQEASELRVEEKLEEIAQKADEVREYTHTLGGESWQVFLGLVRETVDEVEKTKKRYIDAVPIAQDPRELAVNVITESERFLRKLSSRAIQMGEKGRIDEV